MRPSTSLGRLATVLASLSSLASASWFLPEIDALVVRQDSKSSAATQTTTSPQQTGNNAANTFNLNTGAAPTGSSSPSGTTGSGGGSSGSGSGSGSATSTGGGKGSGGNSTSKATHSMFDPTDPAGSVVMVTPAATAPTQLYKVGQNVTWAWNYTNLLGTPTAIDVLASCSAATRLYTLTTNMSFATEGTYTWDTGAYQSSSAKASPLVVNQYTLIIYDADSSISATADPGYLGTFEGFTFGLYTPQSYTPASGWHCVSCSAAVSDMDKRALGFALTMCVVTVLSFTWFVTGRAVPL